MLSLNYRSRKMLLTKTALTAGTVFVLGANAFEDAVLTIDYPNKRLSIEKP